MNDGSRPGDRSWPTWQWRGGSGPGTRASVQSKLGTYKTVVKGLLPEKQKSFKDCLIALKYLRTFA